MEEIDFKKLPRGEAVKLAIELLKFSPSDADEYIAFIRGEIDGDVIEVEDGREALNT